jgi:cytochrome c oxidase subunit II
MRLRPVLALAGTVLLTGCGGEQSALRGEGTRSAAINENTLVLTVLGGLVWVIVVVAVLMAAFRRNRSAQSAVDRREIFTVVLAGVAIPAVIIVAVTAHSIGVLNRIDPRDADDNLAVEVIGHKFWWEVRYPDDEVVTANEVHIPTGERVRIRLETEDVIHSFWVPALTGKMDLIPGETNETWIETDNPGTYWGQCAEYCGTQHARMRFVVVVHEPAEFGQWLAAQAEPAVEVSDATAAAYDDPDLIRRGREVFMSASCVYCHAIAGTEATGTFGPDLTHLASREYLAAGTIPNQRGHLAGWIVDPQSIKPGSLMPGTDISGDDLQALLAYLESLK